jgi:ubiquinone/menaquinone biosynthesis C-methylase UbiE
MESFKLDVHSGERLYPDNTTSIDVEMRDQFDRYIFATAYASGKVCLDAACGAGYGTKALSDSAKSVLGMDFSEDALKHARENYSASNVDFRKADLDKALDLESNYFDLVVSFETIEHLHNQHLLVKEFHRVLKSGGILIISSPNGTVTKLTNEPPNPFHIHELSNGELTDILRNNSFKQEALYGQWKYCPPDRKSITRSKYIKLILNGIYQIARNLKRLKIIFKFARHFKIAERFSAFMGEAKYIPVEPISSSSADNYKVLIAVAKKV